MAKRTNKKTKPFEIGMVPDTQASEGRPSDHLEAAGNYFAMKQPDVIVHIGDHYDMPSLAKSYHKPGSGYMEGKRYSSDIEAGVAAMERFLKPIRKVKGYKPVLKFCLGNHEERIIRMCEEDPVVLGSVIGYKDLRLEAMGWDVIPYLQPITIAGVTYCHYFYNPKTGRPYGGAAMTRLKTLGFSYAQGHQQGFDYAIRELSNGTRQTGLIAGSFYAHDEEYRGPQATNEYRGIVYKHEVHDGQYDIMQVSLDYLLRTWI